MPQQQIWLNGKLLPPEQAVVSVYDHGLLYGDGVFEGIRIYNGRIFKCASHLRRLTDSAQAIRLKIPYTAEELTQAMRSTLRACQRDNGYIRLCVTRGVGALGLNPFTCERPSVFIIVDGISLYPAEVYDKGLAIITASTMRNHPAALSPRIKSLNYLNNILAKIEAIDAGMSEAVMLNHLGYVAECTADNLFLVQQPRGEQAAEAPPRLLTPPLHAGALGGITRDTVLELARGAGLNVEEPNLTKYDLYTADEMFLTGTAAEIIPVTHVDGRTIGDGRPGLVTQTLTRAFRELVANNAPED